MTLRELSQLYHLTREIEDDRRRLEVLRSKSENTSAPPITDMPRGNSITSKVERYAPEKIRLEQLIADKQKRCEKERTRLLAYINGIEDSLTRRIFTFRFVEGMSWTRVADLIGGSVTDGYVRNACYRHLKRAKKKRCKRCK